jgi:large subunit ribosomal protein L22e
LQFRPPKQFDAAAYEKFLVDHIKVEGKTGQLGEDVKITRETPGQLAVTSSIPMSKRYLKYLTKASLVLRTRPRRKLTLCMHDCAQQKFLKKHLMREWLRCVNRPASDPWSDF